MKKFLPFFMCLALMGCSKPIEATTASVEATEASKATEATEVSKATEESDFQDVIIHIDKTESADNKTDESKVTNNDPEAAKVVDDLFNRDSYHLLVTVNDQLQYEVNAPKGDYLDTSLYSGADGFSELDTHPTYIDKAKGVSLSRLSAGNLPGTTASWAAQATDTSIYDILDGISSDDFTDLTINDGVVTGKCDLSAFDLGYYAGDFRGDIKYDGEADVTIDGDITLQNDDVTVIIHELDDPAKQETVKGIVTYQSANPKMLETTGKSEYDFSSRKPEDYLRWAKSHVGDTDTNGVKFIFTYDHSISDPTFGDVYIDPYCPYDSFKTLGDFIDTVKRFEEYKAGATGKEAPDFSVGDMGLPKWYYDKVY